ncbi:Gfo/Idh/MocA family oxidoreductase [Dinghuibacter silviterrae]|uniref:Putative dehydrogenase n=1 Tax=Dinghuibacter silviterrae TaxID=1539049 RepID=A0A4R8DFP7_9BACT|nr:Gfo/Idh/MocA family oxidoreductase [Dinghuibacter silviterrae]TDW96433.1 putative dehydrogenase [Dinghuibacter silviterrae]
MPINTALLSFGMSGRVFHAPFLHALPEYRLYAVWERDKHLATALYPDIRTYRSLEALLEDPAIALVVVNTPNYTHYTYTKQALLAGKHVVVEKPFTATVAEAAELKVIAEQNGLYLSVFQNRRYDSDYRTVKQVIDSGVLGNMAEAEIHFDRYNRVLSPKTHKEVPGPGTGIHYDLGPHLIDQALQLFGWPEAVWADLRIQRPTSRVEDYMEIVLDYGGFPVRLKSGYLVREALPAYVMHGANGSFLKSRSDVQEADLTAGKPSAGEDPESEWGLLHTDAGRQTVPSLKGDYGDFYRELAETLEGNRPLPVTAEEGLAVMRVIEAAALSNREKRWVSC